jgi:hypothetical protein
VGTKSVDDAELARIGAPRSAVGGTKNRCLLQPGRSIIDPGEGALERGFGCGDPPAPAGRGA